MSAHGGDGGDDGGDGSDGGDGGGDSDGEGEGEGGGDAGWWMVTSVSACTCPISCASAEAAIASMTSGRSMTLEGWMEQELEWQGITLKGRGTRRWLGSG